MERMENLLLLRLVEKRTCTGVASAHAGIPSQLPPVGWLVGCGGSWVGAATFARFSMFRYTFLPLPRTRLLPPFFVLQFCLALVEFPLAPSKRKR